MERDCITRIRELDRSDSQWSAIAIPLNFKIPKFFSIFRGNHHHHLKKEKFHLSVFLFSFFFLLLFFYLIFRKRPIIMHVITSFPFPYFLFFFSVFDIHLFCPRDPKIQRCIYMYTSPPSQQLSSSSTPIFGPIIGPPIFFSLVSLVGLV